MAKRTMPGRATMPKVSETKRPNAAVVAKQQIDAAKKKAVK